MQIKNITFCESAQYVKTIEGKDAFVLFNPTGVLPTRYIPGTFSFCVSFIVVDVDHDEVHSCEFNFADADGNLLMKGPITITVPSVCPLSTVNTWIELRNVDIQHEGTHIFTITHGCRSYSEAVEVKKI